MSLEHAHRKTVWAGQSATLAGASKNLLESSHEFHALKLHQRGEAFGAALVILAL